MNEDICFEIELKTILVPNAFYFENQKLATTSNGSLGTSLVDLACILMKANTVNVTIK